MKLKMSITGSGSLEKSLRHATRLKESVVGELATLGDKALLQLKAATPTKTGKTAKAWGYDVERNQNGVEIAITNDSVTKTGIPIVVLLKNGHGTGTGGYVPPNDFITPVANEFLDSASRAIDRRLRR